VAPRINLNLAQTLHCLPPEFLKAFRQTVRELAIPNEQRSESPLLRDVDGRLMSALSELDVQVVKALSEMQFWRKLALAPAVAAAHAAAGR
jgi:hypothetical protein